MKAKRKLSVKKLQQILDNYVLSDKKLSILVDCDSMGEESEINTDDYSCQYNFCNGYAVLKINPYNSEVEKITYFDYDDNEVNFSELIV
ncbi:hypothetical protein KA977_12815 [Candidatus Dependentiae bacterium]|nr:hypothetical protein [Candidatus Dependentiae bacterium]